MQNSKNLLSLSVLCLAAAMVAGCAGWGRHDERTEAQASRDSTITSNVKQNLSREPVYKFHDVDVRTFGGVVQLSGFVNTEEQKNRAGQIAQQTLGVDRVINSLALKPQVPTPTGRTDQPANTLKPQENITNPPQQPGGTNGVQHSNP